MPVICLAFGKNQFDRQAHRINKSVDFGGQPAARAAHATGSDLFFYHWRRAGVRGSMMNQSSERRPLKPLTPL
jgi:hypothetical protein